MCRIIVIPFREASPATGMLPLATVKSRFPRRRFPSEPSQHRIHRTLTFRVRPTASAPRTSFSSDKGRQIASWEGCR